MFFFTEPSKVLNQTVPYGPVTGNESMQFRATSVLPLSATAKLFAIQSGMMLVLPGADASHVTVVLKPLRGTDIPFTAVHYYIMRGVPKNSFITSANAVKPATESDSSDFIKKLWKDHEDFKIKTNNPTLPDPTPDVFGYSTSSLPYDFVTLEFLFNAHPESRTERAIYVKEGDWIASIQGNIGLDILTDADALALTVGDVDKDSQVFDVSALPSATQQEQFHLRAEKEKIAGYMDAAAFWGMHYNYGLFVYDAATTGSKKKISKAELYDTIVGKYLSKNRVYVDIRSERGYSYNFYQNYGDASTKNNLRFKPTRNLSYTESKYGDFGWPVYYDNGGNIEENNGTSNFYLQLRTDDNIRPLLFAGNDNILKTKSQACFMNESMLVNSSTTGWTNDIVLQFPNINTGSIPVNVANHLRIDYFRQADSALSPATNFRNQNVYDQVFGGIDLLAMSLEQAFLDDQLRKKHFINGSNFACIARTGAYYNIDKIVLYAAAVCPYKNSSYFYPELTYPVADPPLIDTPTFPKYIAFNRFQLTNETATQTLDILEVAGYSTGGLLAANKEDIFLLGLTRSEFESLQSIPGFSDKHSRYIAFEPASAPFVNSQGYIVKVFRLKVRGINPEGSQVITVAPAGEVLVYGSSGNLFASDAFAKAQAIPYRLPDPVAMQEYDFVGEWDYRGPEAATLMGGDAITSVPDKFNQLGLDNPRVELNAHVFYPADAHGDAISTRNPAYPVIVIMHGNGQRYESYDFLCRHLAKNGFLVASIDGRILHDRFELSATGNSTYPYSFFMEATYAIGSNGKVYPVVDNDVDALHPLTWVRGTDFDIEQDGTSRYIVFFKYLQRAHGMAALGRAHLIFRHLAVLERKFTTRLLLNNIGIMGHSRGGEAVLTAVRINPAPLKYQIKSIISLAPTDQYDLEKLVKDIPYLVVYGSRDEDVTGQSATSKIFRSGGFSLWDRAINATQKSMAFVYKATHNGFITKNDEGAPDPVNADIQKMISRAYMGAFYRMTLRNEAIWKKYFTGQVMPKSIASIKHAGVYFQFQDAIGERSTIDDFGETQDSEKNWAKTATGQDVSFTTAVAVAEDEMKELDSYSPHHTQGIRVTWKANDKLSFSINPGSNDYNGYDYLSFRVAKVFQREGGLQEIGVELMDTSNRIFTVFTNEANLHAGFRIPDPEGRPKINDKEYTKSALMTVLVPLSKFRDAGVSLSSLKKVSFLFPATGNGDVDIDTIQFSKK